jgi:cell division transport system ATP-binding protein
MRISESLDTKILIEFKNLDFAYKNANKNLLHKVSCTFNSHNFYLLTGDSGSGKTSFLKLIYRGLLPTSGDVYVLGQNTQKLNYTTLPLFRQKIGIIPQRCQLFEHLTIKENVSLPLKMMLPGKYSPEVYAMELIDWVELGQYANCYPKELSAGQRLRIAVARAVIRKPKIILADELTGNIDESQRIKIMSLFHELTKTGTTVILSTHDRHFASTKGLCEVRIRNGNVYSQRSLKTIPAIQNMLG